MIRDQLASVSPAVDSGRAASVLAAARARHDAMSPARRALADVGADVLRLVVVASKHELATLAMDRAGVPRDRWRQGHSPGALHGHAPGTPLLMLTDPAADWAHGVLDEMLTIIQGKAFVRVELEDVVAVLGDQ